jgi:hypothetical protein
MLPIMLLLRDRNNLGKVSGPVLVRISLYAIEIKKITFIKE